MAEQQEMDRVCGMWIDMKEARFTSNYKGETYYFCAQECKDKFDQSPDLYMKGFEGRTI
ncbi:MAG: YHS domain-containing protein [Nitrospira sp.]|nr:YHS domain-containing protein [Nitrospira sp.]MCA9500321.1 YHS domain-containing protein [Nitrospira sp.]